MRLTCPKCGAVYELDAGLIAPGGQHVQCSACHTRWFARRPALAVAPAAERISEDEIIARLEARPRPRPVPDPVAGATSDPTPLRAVPSTAAPRMGGSDFHWEEPAAPAAVAARSAVFDRPHLQVVADPADDGRPSFPAAEADRPSLPTAEAPAPSGRPRLTLDPPRSEVEAPRSDLQAPPAPASRRFGLGLFVGLALSAALFALYRFEEEIAARLPEAAPYTAAYTGAVDEARLWLEARTGRWLAALRQRVGG